MEWYNSIGEWLSAPADRFEIWLIIFLLIIMGRALDKELHGN